MIFYNCSFRFILKCKEEKPFFERCYIFLIIFFSTMPSFSPRSGESVSFCLCVDNFPLEEFTNDIGEAFTSAPLFSKAAFYSNVGVKGEMEPALFCPFTIRLNGNCKSDAGWIKCSVFVDGQPVCKHATYLEGKVPAPKNVDGFHTEDGTVREFCFSLPVVSRDAGQELPQSLSAGTVKVCFSHFDVKDVVQEPIYDLVVDDTPISAPSSVLLEPAFLPVVSVPKTISKAGANGLLVCATSGRIISQINLKEEEIPVRHKLVLRDPAEFKNRNVFKLTWKTELTVRYLRNDHLCKMGFKPTHVDVSEFMARLSAERDVMIKKFNEECGIQESIPKAARKEVAIFHRIKQEKIQADKQELKRKRIEDLQEADKKRHATAMATAAVDVDDDDEVIDLTV
jgi:hypothetical protein